MVTKDENFNCPICTEIALLPTKCKECEKYYCEKCIMLALQNSEECPSCKTEFIAVKKLPRIEKNILNDLKFKCLRCKEEIRYEEMEKHAKELCPMIQNECPAQCKIGGLKD